MERFEREELKKATRSVLTHPIKVRLEDVDAAGIVFFAQFFHWVHEAYEEFLAQAGNPLPEVLEKARWAAPIRHTEADYRAPVRFGDRLEVQLVLARVAESEITLGWKVLRIDGKLCATIQTVHTFVTVREFQRTVVPPGVVGALKPILG